MSFALAARMVSFLIILLWVKMFPVFGQYAVFGGWAFFSKKKKELLHGNTIWTHDFAEMLQTVLR